MPSLSVDASEVRACKN